MSAQRQPTYATFVDETEDCGPNELSVYVETESKQLKRINIILDPVYTIRRIKAMYQHFSRVPMKGVPIENFHIEAEKSKTPSFIDLFGETPKKEAPTEPAPPKKATKICHKGGKPSLANLFGETPEKKPSKQEAPSKKAMELDHKAKPRTKSNARDEKPRSSKPSKERSRIDVPSSKPAPFGDLLPESLRSSAAKSAGEPTNVAKPKDGSAKRRLSHELEEFARKSLDNADFQLPKRPLTTSNKKKNKIYVPPAFSFSYDLILPKWGSQAPSALRA